jgi:hypothetical protein
MSNQPSIFTQVFHLVVDYLFETASSPDRLRSVQVFGTGLGDAIAKVGYLAGQDLTGEILMVINNEGTTQSIFHKMTRWYAPSLQPPAAHAPPSSVVLSSTLPPIHQPTVDIEMVPIGAAAPRASRSSAPKQKPQSNPKGKGKGPAVPKNQPVTPWSNVLPPQARGHRPPTVNHSTKPKHSFAQAARSALSGTPGLAAMDSLASLVRAFPDLPPSEIVCLNNQATGCSSHNCKKKKMTTAGPSRRQALLTFTPDTGVGVSLRPNECTHLVN